MYKIKNAVWEITLSCNISCLHCGSNADINKRPKELSTAEACHLIEQLSDLGCERIVLSGGEPFMRKDWSVLANRIIQLGMRCEMISNGFIVNEDIMDTLQATGISYIGFSLDGACAKTHDYIRGKEGVFDHLMWVFDNLKKRGFKTSAITTVHKGNIAELDDIRKVLLDHSVDAWQIQTANIRGRMPKEWAITEEDFYSVAKFIAVNRNRYYDFIHITEADCMGYFSKLTPYMGIKKWSGCSAGLRTIGIESDGKIKGCLSMQHPMYIEGNIREKSLKDIWTNPDGFKYNRRFDLSMLDGICKDCKYGGICRGGCSEKAMTYTGKLHCQPFCLYDMERKGKA